MSSHHLPSHTHSVTRRHTLAVLHKHFHSHPSSFGDVEQFPKRFMDSLIMQRQRKKQKQKQTINIILNKQQIHDKCTANISIIPSMLVLNKHILTLTEIKNKHRNYRPVETATDKNHTIFFFFFLTTWNSTRRGLGTHALCRLLQQYII